MAGKRNCPGPCEGRGVVPVHYKECKQSRLKKGDQEYLDLWLKAEKKKPSKDGYHFIRCLTCGGTGMKPSTRS